LPCNDVRVVIRMCRINGHVRTLARVFQEKFSVAYTFVHP
jgi:hypothetical protein